MNKNELLNFLDKNGENFLRTDGNIDKYDLAVNILEHIREYPSDPEVFKRLLLVLPNQGDFDPEFEDSYLYHYFEISTKESCLPHLISLIESQDYDLACTGVTLVETKICTEIAIPLINLLKRKDLDAFIIERVLDLLKNIDGKFGSDFYNSGQEKLTSEQLKQLDKELSRDKEIAKLKFLSLADEAYSNRDYKRYIKILNPLLDDLPPNYRTKYKISEKRVKI